MLDQWFQRKANQAVKEAVSSALEVARQQIKMEAWSLLKGDVASEDNQIVVGPQGDHTILDFECQEAVTLSGQINVMQMQPGEAIRFQLDIRWTDGELVPYWKNKEISGLQEEPLYAIDPIICPRGARLKVEHMSGGPIPIKYFFVRRSP